MTRLSKPRSPADAGNERIILTIPVALVAKIDRYFPRQRSDAIRKIVAAYIDALERGEIT